jgi:hypothetical protein
MTQAGHTTVTRASYSSNGRADGRSALIQFRVRGKASPRYWRDFKSAPRKPRLEALAAYLRPSDHRIDCDAKALPEKPEQVGNQENQKNRTQADAGPTSRAPPTIAVVASATAQQQYQDD